MSLFFHCSKATQDPHFGCDIMPTRPIIPTYDQQLETIDAATTWNHMNNLFTPPTCHFDIDLTAVPNFRQINQGRFPGDIMAGDTLHIAARHPHLPQFLNTQERPIAVEFAYWNQIERARLREAMRCTVHGKKPTIYLRASTYDDHLAKAGEVGWTRRWHVNRTMMRGAYIWTSIRPPIIALRRSWTADVAGATLQR